MRIDLTKYRDLDVQIVEMRSTNSEDTLAAAARCVPLDGTDLNPSLFGIMLRQQLIAEAIVSVDGKQCVGPCVESIRWSTRTREFVAEAFDYMNGVTNDERDDFRKALAGSANTSSPRTPSFSVGAVG